MKQTEHSLLKKVFGLGAGQEKWPRALAHQFRKTADQQLERFAGLPARGTELLIRPLGQISAQIHALKYSLT